MSSLKQQIRTNQALQVIQHANSGMNIIDACQEVGIPRSTFYYFVDHNPDAIASFQELQMIAAIKQFALILDPHSAPRNQAFRELFPSLGF